MAPTHSFKCFWLMALLWITGGVFAGTTAFAQDLTVNTLTSSNTQPRYGQAVTLTIAIRNGGSANSTATNAEIRYSNNNSITTSDPLITTINVPIINAGQTYTTTASVVIPPIYGSGQRWVGVIVNRTRQARETNYTNNTNALQLLVQVGTAPDLTFSAFTLSKTSFNIGETVTVNFTVNNIGNAEAPATSVSVRLSTNTTISTQDPELKSVNIPKIAAGGNYKGSTTFTVTTASSTNYIGVFADPVATGQIGKVSESNEGNNTSNIQVNITSPDLDVTAVLVTPGNFKANDKIDIAVTVRNIGSAASTATDVALYFSLNTTLGTSDRKVSTVTLPAIAAGAKLTVNTSITVTAAQLQGFSAAFYLIANADDAKTVIERSETNNTGYYRVNQSGVDLLPTSITLSTTTIPANGQVTVTFKIRNNGNQASTATTASIHYSIDANFSTADTRLTTVNIPAIAAGTEQTFTAQTTLPNNVSTGTRYIAVYADFNRSNSETEELNNFIGTAFTVATVNLQVTAFTVTPTSALAGAQVTITFTIRNTGSVEAPLSRAGVYYSTNSTISTGDTNIQDINIPKIAANTDYKGTATITIPSTFTPRSGYLGIYADRNNQVQETNESFSDNGRGAPFTIPADIDLQPTTATASKTTVTQGESITGNMSVKNNGKSSAGVHYGGVYFSTDSKWDSSDPRVGTTSFFNNHAAGATLSRSANIRIPTNATVGTAYLIFRADYSTRINETNENNNDFALKITVTGRPDLSPSANVPSTTSPLVGSTISVQVTVKNLGGAATTAAALSIYLSTNTTLGSQDTFLGTTTLPSIAGNKDTTLTLSNIQIPTSAQPGTYYLISFADAQRSITESNENNNTLATRIDITRTATADLAVPNLSTSKTSAKGGDSLNVIFAVRNTGTANAIASTATVYFSTSPTPTAQAQQLATQAVPALTAGSTSPSFTVSVTIPATAQAGQAYLHITADATKVVTEGDETNNTTSVPLTITASDPDNDKDGSPASKDCDDNDKTVFPGAKESCDGKDNDCNKLVDDGSNLCPTGQRCDTAAKQCVSVTTEPPKGEPRPEPPRPDAGPADTTPPSCPGGCAPGEVCINNRCVVLPERDETPENDETTPELSNEGGASDQPAGETLINDISPGTDTNTGTDTNPGTDTNNTQDNTPGANDPTPGADTTPVITDSQGTGNDSSTNTDLNPPSTGCGCSSSESPALPFLLFLFAAIALIGRKRHT